MKIKILQRDMLPEDRAILIKGFKDIKALREIAKAPKKDYIKTDLTQLMKREIADIRSSVINSLCTRFYTVQVTMGKFNAEETFSSYPTTEDIRTIKLNMFSGLRKKKQETLLSKYGLRNYNKIYNKVKSFTKVNRGYEYEMIGSPEHRIFANPGTILTLMNDPDVQYKRLTKAKLPYDNNDYVGVELELICNIGRQELNTVMLNNKLAGVVYVKADGSLRAENDSEYTHEVTVLGKQKEINTIIEKVCKILTSKEVGGYVNNTCGLHVHIDMRQRDASESYTKLFRALPVLAKLVPKNRIEGESGTRYCKLNKYADISNNDGDRYKAINDCAIRSHKTLEVRLHSGSLNATKINNWINILLGIIETESVPSKSCATVEDMFETFTKIDKSLIAFAIKRADKFKDATIDTRADHFDNVA